MLALLFPGQGSQHPGMGADLFDAFPDLVTAADDLLGYSVRELCLEGGDRLYQTEFAQPALYVVSALTYLHRHDTYREPRFFAGHSLGEWSALFAAGCVDFLTGLRLVRRRGELMAGATGGSMAAVLGVPVETLRGLLAEADVDTVDIANHNAPGQLVLAGPRDAIRLVGDLLAARNLGKWVPLNVSVAAHSRYLAAAADEFREVLRGVTFAPPAVPVVSNVTATCHAPATMADRLSEHLCRPVRWWDTMCLLARQGVDEVAEVGPDEVLTKMWHRAERSRPAAAPAPGTAPATAVDAAHLGSTEFRQAYRVRYAYLAGAMGYGVSGPRLLAQLARNGLLGFLGTAGRALSEITEDCDELARDPDLAGRYGISLPVERWPGGLVELTGLADRYGIRYGETTGHYGVTPELVRWRFAGARRDGQGRPVAARLLVVKVAHAERAAEFLAPPAGALLAQLRQAGALSDLEIGIAEQLPVSQDVCVEVDGSWGGAVGHLSLLPAVLALRDGSAATRSPSGPARIGVAGGLGHPATVAAAFLVGADFVLTGSVNQCSPQARTSAAVKDVLASVGVDDTAYAPTGELFELGGRSRVVRRGTLFAARAEQLYQLYRSHGALDDLDRAVRSSLEERMFQHSLERVWHGIRAGAVNSRAEVDRAERDLKHRMALVFRWYVDHATSAAVAGEPGQRLNYRIPCSPAMGVFNRYVATGPLSDWRARDVDTIADTLMSGAAELLTGRLRGLPDRQRSRWAAQY